MEKNGENVLVIVSKLPASFENKKDARLLHMLKYFARTNRVHLLYVQLTENDEAAKKEFKSDKIDVFQIREKRKAGIYDLEAQLKEILQDGGYGSVYFNGYYFAKYYLPYVEAYLPEAVVMIDSAHSQFASALEYADRLPEGVRRTVALKNAENRKIAEMPILSHADVIIVDNEKVAAELGKMVTRASFKIFKDDGLEPIKENIFSDITKAVDGKPVSIEAVFVSLGKNGALGVFEKENALVLSQYPNVKLRKVEGVTFAECFNKAVKVSDSEYTFFFSDDIMINKRTLKDLLFCCSVNPHFGIACPASNLTTGVNVDLKQIDNFISKHYRVNIGNWESKKYFSSECFLIRNELIRAIGALDTRFRTLNYALFDYCLKAFQAGHAVIEVNESFVFCSKMKLDGAREAKADKKLLLSKWGYSGAEFLEKLA